MTPEDRQRLGTDFLAGELTVAAGARAGGMAGVPDPRAARATC